MKVSVVIVNYNGKQFVGQCIDSVLHSTFSNFEIIVVDNASTDGSFSYLMKKYNKYSKVKLFRSPKQLYFTGGCNYGAKKASGGIIFFLNSDTIIDKHCIEELVICSSKKSKLLVQPKILFHDNHSAIDNVGGRYSFWGVGHAIGRGQIDRGQHGSNSSIDYVNGTAFMISNKFFWELGGFDEIFRYYYEDVDLSLRAKKDGGSCINCCRAVVYHKGSLTFQKNVSCKTQKFYYRNNRIRTLLKNQKGCLLAIKLPIMYAAHCWLYIADLLGIKKQ